MRPLRARRPLCRDELSCFFVFLFDDTKADWMKCQAHHVAHSCSISRRESVRGPNSLHHWVLKGAWVIAAYLYEWAVWDGSCKEAHVLLFSFTRGDVITRDFLNTRFIHRALLPTQGTSTKQAVSIATAASGHVSPPSCCYLQEESEAVCVFVCVRGHVCLCKQHVVLIG